MQNSEYKNKFAISQSAIKDFQFKSPRDWKRIWINNNEDAERSGDSFTFGSLTDTLLFTPHELESRFYIGEFQHPSPAIESIVKKVQESIIVKNKSTESLNKENLLMKVEELPIDLNSEMISDLVIYAADNCEENGKKGWNTRWSIETRLKKIREQGTEYFNLLRDANGRSVISSTTNMEAISLRDILYKDPDVKEYFVPTSGIELKFQMELFVEYTLEDGRVIPLKGALDILHIDHNNKTIRLVDFKTSYDAHDFIKSIKKFGYATQLSFYDYLLRLWLETQCKDQSFCQYTILNPINIVIDKYQKVPYIYEYDWDDLALEREGNEKFLFDLYQTKDHKMRIKKGWINILEEIAWHYYTDKWDKPRELYENKKIKVNLY